MRLIYALILAMLLSATAMADSRSIPRLSQLIIKNLDLKDASFEEALGKVKEAWKQKYQDDPFPVIVVKELEKPSANPILFTVELKNIPAAEALNYIANGFSMTVRFELDMVYLSKTSEGADAILQARVLHVSPRAARILGFSPADTTSGQVNVRENLQKFGMQIDGDTFAFFDGTFLVIRNIRPEVEKVCGILLLIDSGFTITKQPAEK